MATAKTKFQRNLESSHKEIRGKRAKFLNEDAEVSMRRLVDKEKDKLRDLQRQEMNLEDMHPDSTTTLKVTKDKFDSVTWARELVEVRVEIKLQKAELQIAEDTYKEYFEA